MSRYIIKPTSVSMFSTLSLASPLWQTNISTALQLRAPFHWSSCSPSLPRDLYLQFFKVIAGHPLDSWCKGRLTLILILHLWNYSLISTELYFSWPIMYIYISWFKLIQFLALDSPNCLRAGSRVFRVHKCQPHRQLWWWTKGEPSLVPPDQPI